MTVDQVRQSFRWSLRHGQGLLMSTVQERRTPPPSDLVKLNPFPYGWRDVPVTKPDGRSTSNRSHLHSKTLCTQSLEITSCRATLTSSIANTSRTCFGARLSSKPTAVVLADVEVYWDDPEVKQHRPDIAVILGVRRQKNWPSFQVVEEGTRPALIVEVVSPSRGSTMSRKRLTNTPASRSPIT